MLAFQELSYGRPTGMYEVSVVAVGNRLSSQPPRQRHSAVLRTREVITGPGGASGFDHELRDWLRDLRSVTFEVRGRPLDRKFTWRDYRAAGIYWKAIDHKWSAAADSDLMDPAAAFVRMLAHHLGDEVLLTPQEILDLLGRRETSVGTPAGAATAYGGGYDRGRRQARARGRDCRGVGGLAGRQS